MFSAFDTSRLNLLSLDSRKHNLDLSAVLPLKSPSKVDGNMKTVARKIIRAREKGAAVVLMMGAHVIRSGVQRFIIDLMEREYISCLAANGACMIHDYEFALIGQTTECVRTYIADGRFGLWKETGSINDIVTDAAGNNEGLGEAIGKAIAEGDFPHKKISIFAAAYQLNLPVTVHIGIGFDIVHQHPNCNGAAYGAASYLDFLRFAKVIESLEKGVVMNFGSAVMAPEIFLKALAMARNVAAQENRKITDFTTLVCDLRNLPEDFRHEASKENPEYFFRPWKTMLIRTVADGGKSYYVRMPHLQSIPELWSGINSAEKGA